MEYYLIKGRFRVVGYSPDGDSLKFEANNKRIWNKVHSSYKDEFEAKLLDGNGIVQLRLQGIDALETHYSSPMPTPAPKGMKGKKYSKAEKPSKRNFNQPKKFGLEATNVLLEKLGADEVEWKNSWTGPIVKSIGIKKGRSKKSTSYSTKNKEPLEGYIVINDFDRKGRPIAWVFGGKTAKKDGSKLTDGGLNKMLKGSGNYKLVSNGLVYPYFFFTLAANLRNTLMYAVQNAQRQKRGIWAEDETAKGLTLRTISKLEDGHIILPYLFRRLIKHQYRRMWEGYYEAVKKRKAYKPKTQSLFLDTFFDDSNPYVFMIKEREFKPLDQIVKVTKTKIMMKTHPGNIVFLG